MGNPTEYLGKQLTWDGKELTGVVGTASYTYDMNGLRTTKTVNNVTTDYFYNNTVLMGLTDSDSNTLRFSYDAAGNAAAVNYNGTYYYYLRNGQGDIVKLIDGSGNTVVEYSYDSWGKPLSCTGTLATTLGTLNPFRYRGYVYDEETGFYYLKSRYYDPEACRFVSADVLLSTGQGVLGHNCYAYCDNSPVNRIDYDGHSWSDVWEIIEAFLTETQKTLASQSSAYAACGSVALADGPFPYGDAVGAVGAAFLFIGAIGYSIYQTARARPISAAKAEKKEIDIEIAPLLPSSTVIYRYGGANPGNLTPRAKDRYTGLSFSTVPMHGAAMTTIEALNSTGLVYAVRDGATHVSVRPIGGTMDDWIKEGPNSIWTQAIKSVVTKY